MRALGNYGCRIAFADLVFGDILGRGSYGIVYRGKFRGTTVAIKRLVLTNQSAEDAESFFREVETLYGLRHPNVVLLMGACIEPGHFAIVTEYMPRGTLHSVLKDTPGTELSMELRVRMCLDVCYGMRFLHENKDEKGQPKCVLHRDLKSPNLLVSSSLTVKVADFGLTRFKETAGAAATAGAQNRDASTSVERLQFVGSMYWTAPEVMRNQPYTEACDVYSFGIILWEIVTRAELYAGLHPLSVGYRVLKQNLRPELPDAATSIPEMIALMQRCWDAEPETRPSFAQIAEELETIQRDYFQSDADEAGDGDAADGGEGEEVAARSSILERLRSDAPEEGERERKAAGTITSGTDAVALTVAGAGVSPTAPELGAARPSVRRARQASVRAARTVASQPPTPFFVKDSMNVSRRLGLGSLTRSSAVNLLPTAATTAPALPMHGSMPDILSRSTTMESNTTAAHSASVRAGNFAAVRGMRRSTAASTTPVCTGTGSSADANADSGTSQPPSRRSVMLQNMGQAAGRVWARGLRRLTRSSLRRGQPATDPTDGPATAERRPAHATARRPAGPVGDVTIVRTRMYDAATLWEQEPAGMREAVVLHNRLLRALANRFNGLVARVESDQVMVVFEQTIMAMRFCCALQMTLLEVDWPAALLAQPQCSPVWLDGRPGGQLLLRGPSVAMAVHCGPVQTTVDETGAVSYAGETVEATEMLCAAVGRGQTLASDTTWRRLEPILSTMSADVRRMSNDAPTGNASRLSSDAHRVGFAVPGSVPDDGADAARFLDEVSVTWLGRHKVRGIAQPETLWQIMPMALARREFPRIQAMVTDPVRWQIPRDEVEVLLDRRLWSANIADIFEGRWRGRTVAVKRMRAANLTEAAWLDLRAELHMRMRVQHPNINAFLGLCVGTDVLELMQFASRGTLENVLYTPPLTPLSHEQRSRMLLDVANGMTFLHELHPPILHLNLSVQNCMVDDDFTVRIGDFGQATSNTHLTTAGFITYAPEILRGSSDKASTGTDVYAFGILCYEVLCRRPPFRAPKTAELVSFFELIATSAHRLSDDVDESYRGLVRQMLDQDPSARPSFRSLLESLARASAVYIRAGPSSPDPGDAIDGSTRSANAAAVVLSPTPEPPSGASAGSVRSVGSPSTRRPLSVIVEDASVV